MRAQTVNIIGAGLAGALLAILLGRRGFAVNVYEKRPDPRRSQAERGRSINLALAARGIRALERAGVMNKVHPLLIPMRGRMLHEIDGRTSFLPYGQRENEVIHSVGRAPLNKLLIEEAALLPNVKLNFGHSCLAVNTVDNTLRFLDTVSNREYETSLAPTIAADGGGSAVRRSLAATGLIEDREEPLDHDYKELTLPPAGGRHSLDPHALHIWPRGGFMLIILPNPDLSFTATLFLAREGPYSFAALDTPQAVRDFFLEQFADAVPLIPRLDEEFAAHPQAQLGTVYAAPWHIDGLVLLIGDAAHAMVPFHGQGMNAAFEDCAIVDQLLDRHEDWAGLFAAFEEQRRPHAAAIAQMALENYIEMRETVRDAQFARHKAIALELERRFPDRFIPRYSMVMFHPEIPYGEALRRGAVQAGILEELERRADATGGIDLSLSEALVREHLAPLPQ